MSGLSFDISHSFISFELLPIIFDKSGKSPKSFSKNSRCEIRVWERDLRSLVVRVSRLGDLQLTRNLLFKHQDFLLIFLIIITTTYVSSRGILNIPKKLICNIRFWLQISWMRKYVMNIDFPGWRASEWERQKKEPIYIIKF